MCIVNTTSFTMEELSNNAEKHLELYKFFFTNSCDLTCIANTQGYFEILNPNWTKVLGYSEKELTENPFLSFIHPDDVLATQLEIEKLKSQVTTLNFINRYRKKNGVYIYLDWTTAPDPVTGKLYAIARDITDRMVAEANLKKAKKDLETLADHLQQQNNQLLNFAFITSHNLRSPVSNLNSLLKFYKESTNNEYKQLLLGKFETVVVHLTATLNELIDALKTQVDLSKGRARIAFEGVFATVKETLAGHIIESHARVTADFKVKSMEYPKSYLESILLNLISNAIKYRALDRAPEIHLQTEIVDNEVVLSVRDNGMGIDLTKHGNQLFGLNKTFHLHPESKGVGLYITKTQVEALGGEISVESEVDKGTTFKIRFVKGR